MYKCRECGGEFEEPETYNEMRPVGYERFDCCPYCGRRDYGEIAEEEEDAA